MTGGWGALQARVMRRLPHRRDESGTSLVELAAAMFLFGIIVASVATLSIGFARTNAENMNRQDQVDVARSSVERMSRNVRTAVMPSQMSATCTGCTEDAFVLGKNLEVQFYANVDNTGNTVGPSRVTYQVTNISGGFGTLVEKVQVPDSATPTASGYQYCNAELSSASAACKARLKTRILARGVDTSTPLFSYYNQSGTRLTPASAGLTATDLSNVLGVELHLTVQQQSAVKANGTTYIQRITLPNAQAVMRQSEDS
ncbi:type IV pilus modification PilV family protein [Cellulomonas composti]|uniref:Prepilin-type N-terminal cleavage/methylation domain-containing protein n=1 Tax=Cellulomonas composti TaxID=266130 RepID=A0A511J709_9CELL|nr:hypothetical protein [Cellulomonas composti]GEL93479.1 hypothetical protein CCO02nite_01370 [Cellulomonas composti]